MAIIDLRKLLEGPSLTVKYTLAYGGLATIIKGLIDTRANGYLFINKRVAKTLRRRFSVRREKIPTSKRLPMSGFNRKVS